MSAAGGHEGPTETVAAAIGRRLAALGVEAVFGVVGSGNLVATEALQRGGARFLAARHETGALCMADGWARVTGRVGVCSVHQGPGLTNAVTGLAEAAKARTPVLVIAGDTPGAALTSNFRIDQHDLANSVGAIAETRLQRRLRGGGCCRAPTGAPRSSAAPSCSTCRSTCRRSPPPRRPSRGSCPCRRRRRRARRRSPPSPTCCRARSGRSSSPAGAPSSAAPARRSAALGARGGALLANSAMAQGIFHGDPWALRISGGFASPVAAELLPQADVVLAFGAALNHWTTRHGELIGPQARVVQVDVEPRAIGANRRIDLAVVGDAGAVAEAVEAELAARGHSATGYRTDEVGAQLAARRWRDEPYEAVDGGRVRRPARLLDRARRPPAVAQDRRDRLRATSWAGPRCSSSVEDARALGLHERLPGGRARAWPARSGRRSPNRTGITVAALGDGGLFFALQELDSAARAGAKLLVAVYDDAAYGAEVHHFAPMGHATDTVRFPDADLAAAARAHGVEAITVRHVDDLAPRRRLGAQRHRARCSSTRRSIPTSAPTGCRKRSAPADHHDRGAACRPRRPAPPPHCSPPWPTAP